MAIKPRFTIDGVDELLRKIKRLRRGNELKKLIRQTLRKAGRPVLASARSFAPEDERTLSGSIKLRASKRSRRSIGVVIGPGSRAELGITSSGYYPAHQHFGLSKHERQMQKDPYLRDAMDVNLENSKRTIAEDLGRGIEKIALR